MLELEKEYHNTVFILTYFDWKPTYDKNRNCYQDQQNDESLQ